MIDCITFQTQLCLHVFLLTVQIDFAKRDITTLTKQFQHRTNKLEILISLFSSNLFVFNTALLNVLFKDF